MKTSNIIYTFLGASLFIGFLVFIFKISIHFPNSMKDVKITDWLSVAFNFIMALLAIWGVLYARNWRESLTESKALEEAINLKYQVIMKVYYAFFTLSLSGIKYHIPDRVKGHVFDDYDTKGLFNSFHDMCNKLDCVRDAFFDLQASRERLVFFGWDFCTDKKNEFMKIDTSVDDLYISRIKLEGIINTVLSGHGVFYKAEFSFPRDKRNQENTDLDNLIKILNDNFVTSESFGEFEHILGKVRISRSFLPKLTR